VGRTGIEGALTSLGAVHEAGLVTRGGSGNLCGCGRGYWLVRCGCLLRRGGGCWLCRYRGVDGMNDRGGGGRNLKDGGRSTLLATLCICTFPDGHGENVKRSRISNAGCDGSVMNGVPCCMGSGEGIGRGSDGKKKNEALDESHCSDKERVSWKRRLV
jgi:hypothetical protein